jgi:CheY-like chemotaxis protein
MRRLVLADDSKTIQKVVALLFEEEDFEVACFENGASALEHIRSRGADVMTSAGKLRRTLELRYYPSSC